MRRLHAVDVRIALAHVGIVLGLEVSRLARNNATVSGSSICAASPTRSSARPTASITRACQRSSGAAAEGTMSRSGAARAGRPIGRGIEQGGARRAPPRPADRLRLGDDDARCACTTTDAVTGVLRILFERFAEMGSVRQVWLWLQSQKLRWPCNRARSERSPGSCPRTRRSSGADEPRICWRLRLRKSRH